MKSRYKKHFILPIIIAIIAAIVIASVNLAFFTIKSKYASATITFCYDGISEGKGPNGEPFDISVIKSDENIAEAIKASGLNLETSEVVDNILVEGVYPDDLIEKLTSYNSLLDYSSTREQNITDYNPVKFKVIIYNNFAEKLSSEDIKNLLNCVIYQYGQYFETYYSAKIDWTTLDSFVFADDADYSQVITGLNFELNLIKNYCTQLDAADSQFEANGKDFSDVLNNALAYENNNLSVVESMVYSNGISKDADSLSKVYEIQLEELQLTNAGLQERLSSVDSLIDTYVKDSSIYLGSASGTAAIKSNSNTTYENLVSEKKEISESIIENQKAISELSTKIEKLKNSMAVGTAQASVEETENSLNIAKTKMTQLKAEFDSLCSEYNKKYQIENVLEAGTISYTGIVSFIKSFIVACIKAGFLTGSIAIIYIMFVGAKKSYKEFRK